MSSFPVLSRLFHHGRQKLWYCCTAPFPTSSANTVFVPVFIAVTGLITYTVMFDFIVIASTRDSVAVFASAVDITDDTAATLLETRGDIWR